MTNAFANVARFFENYKYFLRRGCNLREAWHLAQMTLPER
jgi:hypothetical protein